MKFKIYNVDYRGARDWDVIDPSKPVVMGLHEFYVSFYLIEDLKISKEVEPITVSATILAESYGKEKFSNEHCTIHVQENLFDCLLEDYESKADLIDFLTKEFNEWELDEYYFQKELEQAFQVCEEISTVVNKFDILETSKGVCYRVMQGRKLLKKIEELNIDFSVFPMFAIDGETWDWKRELVKALDFWEDRMVNLAINYREVFPTFNLR
jgi:hypothetical protein